MKRIYAREEHCIACRLCEITCLVRRSRSKNMNHCGQSPSAFWLR